MSQAGEHTWDLVINYHACPDCGYIIENRKKYLYQDKKYKIELECPRCKHLFTVIKPAQRGFWPLFGEPTPIEWDWSEKDEG